MKYVPESAYFVTTVWFRVSKVIVPRPISIVRGGHVTCHFVPTLNTTITLHLRTTPTLRRTVLKPSAPNGHLTHTAHARRRTRPRVLTRAPSSRPATSFASCPNAVSTSVDCRHRKPVASWPRVPRERSYCATAPTSASSSP